MERGLEVANEHVLQNLPPNPVLGQLYLQVKRYLHRLFTLVSRLFNVDRASSVYSGTKSVDKGQREESEEEKARAKDVRKRRSRQY